MRIGDQWVGMWALLGLSLGSASEAQAIVNAILVCIGADLPY